MNLSGNAGSAVRRAQALPRDLICLSDEPYSHHTQFEVLYAHMCVKYVHYLQFIQHVQHVQHVQYVQCVEPVEYVKYV